MIPSAIIALGPKPTSPVRPIPLPVIIKDIHIRIRDKINISSRNRKKLERACDFYRRRLIIFLIWISPTSIFTAKPTLGSANGRRNTADMDIMNLFIAHLH
jgi:hypothetical protein